MEDYYEIIKLIEKQWKSAQDHFIETNFKYKSNKDLKLLAFYNYLFQVLDNAADLILVDNIEKKVLYRAANEKDCDYDRFIPKKEYASDNRMNSEDKLYYYFGIGNSRNKTEAIKTCLKEIRAENNDVCVCEFKFNSNLKELKIVDFTVDTEIPKSQEEVASYMYERFKKFGECDISKTIAKIFINFLGNSYAFEPINKENITSNELKYKYVPFWAITEYLEDKGYDGLTFSSTVYKDGENLVLFDIEKAEYIKGTIESLNSYDYLKNN